MSESPATHVTVIRPPEGLPRPELRELWSFRRICLVLARRSLMVRYRQTLIGAAWTVLQPVALAVVFTVFFGLLARVSSEGVPYPVFVYAALVIWQSSSKVLNEGSLSIVNNAAIVKKIYFPRAYFPISVAVASLLDLAVSFVVFIGIALVFGVVPGAPILLAPIFVAVAMAASLGVSLFLSSLNAAYRDVQQLLPFLSQLWMFVSPVIYPTSIVPEAARPFYWLNPLALSIDGMRWAATGANAPPLAEWLIGVISAAVLLIGGYLYFRGREATFADVV